MKLPLVANGIVREEAGRKMAEQYGIAPSGVCETACDSAQWVAEKACKLVPTWFGLRRKCNSAAQSAGDWCRSKC